MARLSSHASAVRISLGNILVNSSIFAKSSGLIPHISIVSTYHCLCGLRDPLKTLVKDKTLNGGTSASVGFFAMRVGRRMTEQPNALCFLNVKVLSN